MLRVTAELQGFERLGRLVSPDFEVCVHTSGKSGELGVIVDCGLDCRFLHGEVEVAGAVSLEKYISKLWTHLPITSEGFHVSNRDTSAQVTFDVLEVFGLLAVDVARQVEVELVLLNLLDADHPRILWNF